MKSKWFTYLKKVNFRALCLTLMLVTCFAVNPSWAQPLLPKAPETKAPTSYWPQDKEVKKSCDGGDCTSKKSGGRFPPCESTSDNRTISKTCLQQQRSSNNSCIDTMPVDNVKSVSEDVCYRTSWGRNHYGMDYSAPAGSNVYAAADGEIVPKDVRDCSSGYGRRITIRHPRTDKPGQFYTSTYAHLSKIIKRSGTVKKGELIALVGGADCPGGANSANINETKYPDHLHMEFREGSEWAANATVINPMCADLGSLCGTCRDQNDPSDCRIVCKSNPNDPRCQSVPMSSTPYNYLHSTPWASPSLGGPVVPSSASNGKSLGDVQCSAEAYSNSFSKCVFCDLFRILFNTASQVGNMAYGALSQAMISLVIIGMAIWLSITIIKFISAFDAKDPRILLKTIFNQAFVVIIVIVILRSDLKLFLDLVLTPIFNTGMTLAQMVTTNQSGQTCDGFTKVIENGGIPASIGNNILCTIQSIQGKILDIMSLGSTSFCIGFFVESYKGFWFLPSVPYVIVGIILWLTAFLLMVIYPFLLIDTILQLSIAAALLPVAIAAYAFPITRKKYVTKVWETFMTAMFTFLFLSIIVFIITTGVESIVGEALAGRIRDAGTSSSYSVIIDAAEGLAWWGIKFLQLTFMMLLGWAVLDQAKEFAGTFSKGSFKIEPMGSPLGGMAANVATKLGLGVGGKAVETAKFGGKAMKEGVQEKMHSSKVNRMANRALNSSNATTDANGNTTATLKNWRGQSMTRTVSKDASGNVSVSNTKGNKTVTTDKFMTVTSKLDNKGNVVQKKFKMEAAGCKQLTNKDGSLNTVAIMSMRQNSTHNPNDLNEAILSQVLKERMPKSELANMEGSFASRQVMQSDDNTFHILQTNTDGSTTNFSMNINNDRVMTSVEKVSQSGQAVNFSSDGIIQKRSSYNYVDGKVDAESVRNRYAFSSYYTKYDSKPMDSNGRLSASVPREKIMFEQNDLDLMGDQIAKYGQPKAIGEFDQFQ